MMGEESASATRHRTKCPSRRGVCDDASARWRLITEDGVSASFGLAADELMAQRVGQGKSVPTLRLYTYRSHCALIGRHQSLDQEVNRAFCIAHQIEMNRRPTGGGAIIMGADQLGIALTIPLKAARRRIEGTDRQPVPTMGDVHVSAPVVAEPTRRLRYLFGEFSQGIIRALQRLGLAAQFGGKNDIEVAYKKIAGLGLYHDPSGGLLFHASLLVDLDIALMLQILKTPFEKISDKAIRTVAQRVTTIRRELGHSGAVPQQTLTLDSVRHLVAEEYARQFNVHLEADRFSAEERAAIQHLEETKYLTSEWLEQKTMSRDASATRPCMGSGRIKTPGGLVQVQLALAGDVIQAIYITGDFFATDDRVNELERALRWQAAQPERIEAIVNRFFAEYPDALEQVPPTAVTRAIVQAVVEAQRRCASTRVPATEPYGCFVNP